MDSLVQQILVGVLSTLILHYIMMVVKYKNKFNQIERAIFGEEETDQIGLVEKVSQFTTFQTSTDKELKELRTALDSLLTLTKENKTHLVDFEKTIEDITESIENLTDRLKDGKDKFKSYDEFKSLLTQLQSDIKNLEKEVDKKTNKEAHDLELRFITDKIDNVISKIINRD